MDFFFLDQIGRDQNVDMMIQESFQSCKLKFMHDININVGHLLHEWADHGIEPLKAGIAFDTDAQNALTAFTIGFQSFFRLRQNRQNLVCDIQ